MPAWRGVCAHSRCQAPHAPANRSEMALASWLGAVFADCQPMLTTSVDELLQRLFHEGAIFAGVRSACRSAPAFSFQSAGPCSLETGARAATPRMLETLTFAAANVPRFLLDVDAGFSTLQQLGEAEMTDEDAKELGLQKMRFRRCFLTAHASLRQDLLTPRGDRKPPALPTQTRSVSQPDPLDTNTAAQISIAVGPPRKKQVIGSGFRSRRELQHRRKAHLPANRCRGTVTGWNPRLDIGWISDGAGPDIICLPRSAGVRSLQVDAEVEFDKEFDPRARDGYRAVNVIVVGNSVADKSGTPHKREDSSDTRLDAAGSEASFSRSDGLSRIQDMMSVQQQSASHQQEQARSEQQHAHHPTPDSIDLTLDDSDDENSAAVVQPVKKQRLPSSLAKQLYAESQVNAKEAEAVDMRMSSKPAVSVIHPERDPRRAIHQSRNLLAAEKPDKPCVLLRIAGKLSNDVGWLVCEDVGGSEWRADGFGFEMPSALDINLGANHLRQLHGRFKELCQQLPFKTIEPSGEISERRWLRLVQGALSGGDKVAVIKVNSAVFYLAAKRVYCFPIVGGDDVGAPHRMAGSI